MKLTDKEKIEQLTEEVELLKRRLSYAKDPTKGCPIKGCPHGRVMGVFCNYGGPCRGQILQDAMWPEPEI